MKTRNLALLFLLILMQTSIQKSSITPNANLVSAQTSTNSNPQPEDLSASEADTEVIDSMLISFPTNSIYEGIIDQIYGPTGLNVSDENLCQIKNCYCYLEFLIKCDKVKSDTSLSEYTDDFKGFLQPSADNATLMPTQKLVESKGWQAIPVTAQDFIESAMWQFFIKAMICDTLSNDAEFIESIVCNQNLMSIYIPNIENGYYTNEFTALRLYQESMQLQCLRNCEQRNRYLAQCTDWKNISHNKMMDAIAQFKKTDFYSLTHNPQPAASTDKTNKAPKAIVIASPTREQILCYFMLVHIQTTAYNAITENNVESILTQASSELLSPNFFLYNISDLIYLSDSFSLQRLTKVQKTATKKQNSTAAPTSQANITSKASNAVTGQQASATTNVNPAEIQKEAATFVFKKIPALSQYAVPINKIYGKSGLNIPIEDLSNIKKTYCYLEFLAKLNKVVNDKNFAQYKNDFKDYLIPNKDGTAFIPSEALVTSAGWKAITITDKDIMQTPTWHNFVKAMICDCYDSYADFILNSQEINSHIVAYTPIINTEYKTAEFTQFRLYAESLQLNQIIRAEQQKQYLEICPDWEKLHPVELHAAISVFKKTDFYTLTHDMPTQLPDRNTSNKYTTMSEDMKNQILGYYLLITIQTDISAMMTVENVALFLAQASSSILSPNFFTHTPSDFMYLEDFLLIARLTHTNNAILDTAPDSDEIISTANTLDTDDDDEDDEDDEDEAVTTDDTVIIQKIKNPFTKKNFDPKKNGLAKSIKKTNKAAAKALDPKKNGMNKSIKKTNKASARANHRQAVKMKRIQRKQAAGMKRENRRIAKVMKKNEKLICAIVISVVIAVAIIVIAVVTLGAGTALAGPLIMAGQAAVYAATTVGTAAASVAGAVGGAAGAIGGAAAAGYTAGSVAALAATGLTAGTTAGAAAGVVGGLGGAVLGVGALGAGAIGSATGISSVVTAYSTAAAVSAAAGGTTLGGIGAGLAAVGVATTITTTFTGALTAVAVAGTFSVTVAAMADPKFKAQVMKEVIMPIMQGMEEMTDAMTTGLIEISVGFTAMGAGFAQAIGYPVNMKHEMNKTRAKMEKYRSTINVVNSIVLTILMTIAVMALTAGAGMAYQQVALAGYLGQTAQATALASSLATAATAQLAAQGALATAQAGEIAAQLALKKGIEQGVKASAIQTLEKQAAAATAKKLLADQAVKKAGAYAAQLSTKTAARETAISAGKGLATKKAEEAAAQMALKKAIASGADDGVQGILQNKLAAATTERQVAQVAAKDAAETLAQATAKMNADQAASVAARQASSKTASYSERISSSMGRNQIKTTGRTASQQAADQNAARLATKASELGTQQAKQQASKDFALKMAAKNAQYSATVAEQNATKLAADITQKIETIREAQAAATAARTAANQATARVTTNQAAEASIAKQAAAMSKDYVTKEAYTLTAQQANKVAADKALNDLTTKQLITSQSDEAAAIAAKKTANASAKKAINFAAKNPDDMAAQLAKKEAQDAVEQATIKQATATTNRRAAEQAVQNAAKVAQNAQDDLLATASKISQKETERLGARTIMQKTNEEGMWSALKGGMMSFDFILGQALNATFGVFSAMAAVSQDEAAADQLEDEKKSIQSLWQYVEDTKVNVVQEQDSFLDELHKKHQVAVENQVIGLQYYNNYLHSSVVNVQDQIAQALAQQYIQMLAPDSNGLRTSDIGATWGLQTAFTYLYPSQGFISTTLGRPDFPYAQEIAQAPLASESHKEKSATDLTDKEVQATKLWFNQRAVSVLKQAVELPLNVEIKFRVIYNLTTAYHVGLYLGGNYHDYNSPAYLQSIQDTGTVDLNDAHHAKMLVLKRDTKDAAPSIGLYEHEGKGWISQDPVDANILNSASIYHMQANLNKDQLTVSFWTEDKSSQKWTKTTTVNPCDQRTFGVIFSGIAIEWNVVQPNLPITQNKKARATSNGQSEINRERASKAQWKELLNPKFGSMNIQSPGRPALLQGQYLYTTQSTSLTDAQGNPITDYVVFASSTPGNTTNIGISPQPSAKATTAAATPSHASIKPNVILSFITGNVYDSSGKIIARKQNALQAYTQSNKSISQKLIDAISQAGKIYQEQLLNYTFGSYQLSAVSEEALDQGLFIYTCPTTIPQQDASGNPILDYLVMADIVNSSLGSTIGMPPSSTTQGMVSLITGNVYTKTSATPIDSGYSEMGQYNKQYGPLPEALSDAMTAALNAYNNITTAPVAEKEVVIDAATSSQSISLSDLLNAAPPVTGGLQVGLSSTAPSKIISTGFSISQLQNSAAGTAEIQTTQFGSTGFDMSGFVSTSKLTTTPIVSSPTIAPKQDIVAIPSQEVATELVESINNAAESVDATADDQAVPVDDDEPADHESTITSTTDDQEKTANPDTTFALAGSSGFSF